MRPELAQGIVNFLYLVAVPATIYPLWLLVNTWLAATQQQPLIELDTGAFYLFLMSVFFSFFLIQKVGAANPKGRLMANASRLVVWNFFIAMALAISLGFAVPAWLEGQGYSECPNHEVHRVARGKRMVFALGDCGGEGVGGIGRWRRHLSSTYP